MPDPVLVAIAASLAGKTAASLYEFVKKTFGNREEVAAALTAAEGSAPDSPQVKALAEELQKAEAADPVFREGLRSRWATVAPTTGLATQDGNVNQMTGDVGKAVQARDIHGGVSL